MSSLARRALATALVLATGGAAAQDVQAPPSDVITVRGGGIPHCKKREGDPLDAVNVRNTGFMNQVVVADSKGRYRLMWDTDPVTGPVTWQRAGTGIDAYVFRVPTDGKLLCMGSRGAAYRSFAQLRRVLDAKPFHGKYVRFTAFVAARPGTHMRSWLAAVPWSHIDILQGDRQSQPLDSTGKWEPMSITMGPVPTAAGRISYGFLFQGAGDMWITQVNFEVFDTRPADTIRARKPK